MWILYIMFPRHKMTRNVICFKEQFYIFRDAILTLHPDIRNKRKLQNILSIAENLSLTKK